MAAYRPLFTFTWPLSGKPYWIARGGKGVTSAWSPLGNFLEGQAHPNVVLILCYSHVITYGSGVFCITFQSI